MTSRRLPLIRADWPFDVRRLPFFYGWVIWLLSTLGFLMSIPGQTMGMAVFTEPLMAALDLSRTELSTAYFAGTVSSALFLTRAGRWYDRYQARVMMAAASALLAGVVLFIAYIDLLVRWLGLVPGGWFTFVLILLGYFGVRFAGQGVLTSASRNVLLQWFERRRGLVSGVRGVFVSLGFSLAPLLLAWLIEQFGWRGALWLLAAVLGGGFVLACLVLIRDTPEDCGLLPDGAPLGGGAPAAPSQVHSRTLREAQRTPEFWTYALALAVHALFGTAVTFHIVGIFAGAGRSATEAFGYFLPQAVVATGVNLVASWFADRSSLKPFLLLMLAAFSAGAFGLMHLEDDWGYWLLVAGFGTGGGLWGVLSNLAYVRYFGRLHLGEISGFGTAVTVLASAVGPLLFSLGLDGFGTYNAAVGLCLGLNLLLLSVAARLRS